MTRTNVQTRIMIEKAAAKEIGIGREKTEIE
jgi:hypothetical protein